MAVCTFFGHKDTTNAIEPTLRSSLTELIENKNVDLFYVGNNGNFDALVKKLLSEMKINYPFINYYIVLAYLPKESIDCEALYPEGLENTPPKYAIDKRNRWMLSKSDYVITYVTHITGGAYKFKQLANAQNKIIIELSETKNRCG